jgi:multiple sugar transport system substrate-binding protein
MSIGPRRRDVLAAAALAVAGSRRAASQAPGAPAVPIRLRVSHTEPGLFGPVHQRIKERLATVDPTIALEFESLVRDYEEQARNLIRLGMIGQQPDVAFVGLNRVKLLADRGLGAALDPLIARDAEWRSVGLPESALAMGQVEGRVVGLPFAISVPMVFFNADLVRRAGGNPDDFPTTWSGINALARRIAALGTPVTGGYFAYETTGNWTFIALVQSLGGRMMSAGDRQIAFNGAEGMAALEILRDFGGPRAR